MMMPRKPKTAKSLEARHHFLRNPARETKPCPVKRRFDSLSILSQIIKLINVAARTVYRQRKKPVSIVKDRCRTDNLIRIIVHQITEIAKMTVHVECQRIKEKDIRETRIQKRRVP